MNKKIFNIFILFIICIGFVSAANETINLNPNYVPINIENIVLQEAQKTRTDIKGYLDKRIEDFKTDFIKNSQSFLDQNFAILDSQIRNEANKVLLKAEIYLVAGVVFSLLLYLFISLSVKKLLNRKIVTERKVIYEWLEAHEQEAKTMKEFDKQIRDLVSWLQDVKSKVQK